RAAILTVAIGTLSATPLARRRTALALFGLVTALAAVGATGVTRTIVAPFRPRFAFRWRSGHHGRNCCLRAFRRNRRLHTGPRPAFPVRLRWQRSAPPARPQVQAMLRRLAQWRPRRAFPAARLLRQLQPARLRLWARPVLLLLSVVPALRQQPVTAVARRASA